MDAFEEIDQQLAKVVAMQQLNAFISKSIGHWIAGMKIERGYWLCYVPESGWQRASNLLQSSKVFHREGIPSSDPNSANWHGRLSMDYRVI